MKKIRVLFGVMVSLCSVGMKAASVTNDEKQTIVDGHKGGESQKVTTDVEQRGIFIRPESHKILDILDTFFKSEPRYFALLKKVKAVARDTKNALEKEASPQKSVSVSKNGNEGCDNVSEHKKILSDLISRLIQVASSQHKLLIPLVVECLGSDSLLEGFFNLDEKDIVPTFDKTITQAQELLALSTELVVVCTALDNKEVFPQGHTSFNEWMEKRRSNK